MLILTLLAANAPAATFILAPDDATLRGAERIVVATAQSSYARWAVTGAIETVTTMRVDEAIRGFASGATFDLVELGGIVDGIGLAIPGSPRFTDGERVLLLLVRNDRGEWTAKDFVAGVFRFDGDLLLRDEEELCGFDRDGRPHREPQRLAEPFLRYVRAVVNGESPSMDYIVPPGARRIRAHAPTSTYLITSPGQAGTLGLRWSSPVADFRSNGTQPGAPGGGVNAVQRGMQVWTGDSGSTIQYQYVGTTSRTSGFNSSDGVNSIQFNDPSNEIPGAFTGSNGDTLAIGGPWFAASTAGSHQFAGERFYTIGEADLIIQNGITGSGLTGLGFEHVVAHELGHTLGFRHSDEPPAGGTSDSAALMNSSVDFNNDRTGAALQAWDREAAAATYGSGPVCTPPAITAQPRSIDLVRPESVTLSVTATGPALSFQWYQGVRGDTRFALSEGRQAALTVAPQTTTSYWVRVSNNCNPAADSETATVTIAGCPAVQFTSVPAGETILEGRSVTLTARATGGTISYQWFAGTTAIPGATGESITVTPALSTTYVSRATNSCGATADSVPITIEVTPCTKPSIRVQPVGGDVVTGEGAALFADVTGSEPLQLQWYRGVPPDTSSPIASAQTESIETEALFGAASFWLRATNVCGTVDSLPAAIAVVPTCRAPVITVQPANQSVPAGDVALITVGATGTGLRYRWYQGPVFDFTKPVGGSGPTLPTPPITSSTQFWVRIENACGNTNSTAAQVSVGSQRRRAVRR